MNVSVIDRPGRTRLLRWLPHLLVVLGLVLMAVDRRFLLLAGIGIFGPGALVELGWWRAEEFERDAIVRAGHQAFLFGGVLLLAVMAFRGFGQRYGENLLEIEDAVPASLVFLVLLGVYYLSRLIRYWGARAAAVRMTFFFAMCLGLGMGFGAMAAANHGIAANWGYLSRSALIVPCLLAIAFAGRRWPRIAGVLLLGFTVWSARASGILTWLKNGSVPWEVWSTGLILVLLLPIAATLAFLFGSRQSE